eukprot:gene14474-15977_t
MKKTIKLLKKHGKDSEKKTSKKETKELFKNIIRPPSEVDEAMTKFVKIWSALFSMGINFKVGQLLLSNPIALAEKLSFDPLPQAKFKESGNILDYVDLLNGTKEVKGNSEGYVEDLLASLDGEGRTNKSKRKRMNQGKEKVTKKR